MSSAGVGKEVNGKKRGKLAIRSNNAELKSAFQASWIFLTTQQNHRLFVIDAVIHTHRSPYQVVGAHTVQFTIGSYFLSSQHVFILDIFKLFEALISREPQESKLKRINT